MPLPEIAWFHETPKRRRFLAGVSGGADSVALLHLLHTHGFRQVVVCHLDHGLRGRASAADARFVAQLAGRLGYVCESAREDVAARIERSGASLETAARQARHEFFAACAARHRCPRVLLAHHRDDQVETLLWNLLRGSRGLVGMKSERTLQVGGRTLQLIRPLLAVSRDELREELRARKLRWREDATNAEPIAARNRLRHEALPLLAAIARRDPAEALIRAAGACDELREIEAWAVAQAAAVDPAGRLHLPRLRSLPAAVQDACIYDFLRTSGVPGLSREVVARCRPLLDAAAAPAVNLPGGFTLRRRAGRLVLGA